MFDVFRLYGQGFAPVGRPVTATLRVAGLDLTNALVVREARGQEPACGLRFTFTPRQAGRQWVGAEAQQPDGRRTFAATHFDCE